MGEAARFCFGGWGESRARSSQCGVSRRARSTRPSAATAWHTAKPPPRTTCPGHSINTQPGMHSKTHIKLVKCMRIHSCLPRPSQGSSHSLLLLIPGAKRHPATPRVLSKMTRNEWQRQSADGGGGGGGGMVREVCTLGGLYRSNGYVWERSSSPHVSG